MQNKLVKYSSYLLILSLPLYLIRFNIGPVPTTLLEILIYLTFLINLFSSNIKIKNQKVFIISCCLVGAALIGGLIDPELMRGLGLWKAYFLDGLLVYLIFSSQSAEEYLPYLMVSGMISGVLALVFGGYSADGRLLSADGLSSNYLSMFIAPIVMLGLVAVINAKKGVDRLLYLVGEIFLLLILVLTDSRGAYVALAGGLLVLGAQAFSKKVNKTKLVSGFVVAMIIFLVGTFLVFKPTDNNMGRIGSSSNIRYYIWVTSLSLIKQHPLVGLGLGNYQDSFKAYTDGWVNYNEYIAPQALTAHNLYLHLYLTTGLLGLVSFLLFTYLALKNSRTKILIPILAVILIYGLIDTTFFRNDLAIFTWIIFALL